MLQAKAPYPLLIHRRQLLVAAGAGAVFLGTPALAEKQSRDAVVLSLAKLVERAISGSRTGRGRWRPISARVCALAVMPCPTRAPLPNV